jgi:hypothetical protein
LESIFPILEGITRNAPISMIPKIFIEIPINKARNSINHRLYIHTGIHFVFAISSLILRARKFLQ